MLENVKCKNCGGKLIKNDDESFFCERCGSQYLQKEVVNQTNYNTSNTYINNYYGNSAKLSDKEKKIDGYLDRAMQAYYDSRYSEARSWCMKVLYLEPYNLEARLLKYYIESYKGSNGRYSNVVGIFGRGAVLFDLMKDWIFGGGYKKQKSHIFNLLLYGVKNYNKRKCEEILKLATKIQGNKYADEIIEEVNKRIIQVEKERKFYIGLSIFGIITFVILFLVVCLIAQ